MAASMVSRNQLLLRPQAASYITKGSYLSTLNGRPINKQVKMSLLQRSLSGQQSNSCSSGLGYLTPVRNFSYPEHIKIEMPNLSPTMEKVSSK